MIALVGKENRSAPLPTGSFFQRRALVIGGDQSGHQADIGFRQFAARPIGKGVQADVEARLLTHRRELRIGLDQRTSFG